MAIEHTHVQITVALGNIVLDAFEAASEVQTETLASSDVSVSEHDGRELGYALQRLLAAADADPVA